MQLQRLVVDSGQIHDRHILLTTAQQHYLQRVLRLGQGDRLIVMDGQGHSWLSVLRLNHAPSLAAEIVEPILVHTELPVPITLVMALPKGNGFDEVIRQATELGVAAIAPVISDRTLLNPSPQRLERWQRIAQEAAEQSERQIVPTIFAPVPFANYLQAVEPDIHPPTKLIGVTRRAAPHLMHCLFPTTSTDLILAIGPEGGWTDVEVERAIAAQFQPVSLGARILRTVTAPLAALALIAGVWEANDGEPITHDQ